MENGRMDEWMDGKCPRLTHGASFFTLLLMNAAAVEAVVLLNGVFVCFTLTSTM